MITASYANHHLQSAYLGVRLGMEVLRGNLAKLIINVDSHLIHLFFQHLIPIVGTQLLGYKENPTVLDRVPMSTEGKLSRIQRGWF